MSDFNTTTETDEEFDLDEAVEAGEVEDDFQVEDLNEPSDNNDGEGESEEAKAKRVKRDRENADPSEFQYDATPRPRTAGGGKKVSGPKQVRVPVPDGWATPTELVNKLYDEKIVNLKPQAMYGFVKNGAGFPYKFHEDGRYIVPVEDETAQAETYIDEDSGESKSYLVNGPSEVGGRTWVIQALQRRAERLAKADAEAQKQAEAEAETDEPEEVSIED